MRNPDDFDAFYKATRERLLLQTFALTGDLPAARRAVRDAFVAAWHHRRKLGPQPDAEAWVLRHAWAGAQRRHTARIWHRDKGLDPGNKATLDSLAKLNHQQRRVLLLNHLTAAEMPEVAREVGLTRESTERTLQTATSKYALTSRLRFRADQCRAGRSRLRDLGLPLPAGLDHPPGRGRTPPRVHQPGHRGRRGQPGRIRLVRDRPDRRVPEAPRRGAGRNRRRARTRAGAAGGGGAPHPRASHPPRADEDLAGGDERLRTLPAAGSTARCQESRFADPDGTQTLVRTFRSDTPPRGTRVRGAQATELSRNPRSAKDGLRHDARLVRRLRGTAHPPRRDVRRAGRRRPGLGIPAADLR